MNNCKAVFFFMGLWIMGNMEAKKSSVTITVFVHGTHRTNNALGYLPGVGTYVYHPEGLYRPDECEEGYVYRRLARSITQASPLDFPQEHFYIFCWSGVLSHEGRVKAAHELHEALNRLVLQHEKVIYRSDGFSLCVWRVAIG